MHQTTNTHDTQHVQPNAEQETLSVHKDMPIAMIVDMHPDIAELLLEEGVHCVGCGASSFETLYEGLSGHGYTDEQIEEVVDKINKHLQEVEEE